MDLLPIDFGGYTRPTMGRKVAAERSYKFMQSLDKNVFRQLKEKAVERGVTVQELIRAVIIPEWMRLLSQLEAENSLSNERQRVWVR